MAVAGSASAATTSTTSTTFPSFSGSPCASQAKTQLALDRCATKVLTQAQKDLVAALSAEGRAFGKKAVASTQAKWVGFEKAECTLEARPNTGGSIVPLDVASCEIQQTDIRLAQVRTLVARQELATAAGKAARKTGAPAAGTN